MIVIADSNLIFSGLYTENSVIGSILKGDKGTIQFIAPYFIFEEINNHLSEIVAYTGKPRRQLKKQLAELTAKIVFYNTDEIAEPHFRKSIDIVKDIDIDDVFFVALHFQTGYKIWTGDNRLIKGLLNKGYDICITTTELKNSLYKK